MISLGNNVFYQCTALTNITIPNSVESIGDEAFRGCTALETVTLGNKTSEAFLEALGDEEMDVTISEDGRTVIAEFHVPNAAALQFGKSYTLYLDVTAAGAAEDGKPTQIKLTVNVKK